MKTLRKKPKGYSFKEFGSVWQATNNETGGTIVSWGEDPKTCQAIESPFRKLSRVTNGIGPSPLRLILFNDETRKPTDKAVMIAVNVIRSIAEKTKIAIEPLQVALCDDVTDERKKKNIKPFVKIMIGVIRYFELTSTELSAAYLALSKSEEEISDFLSAREMNLEEFENSSYFSDLMGEFLNDAFKQGGSDSLLVASKAVGAIEKKMTGNVPEEQDFLECVSECARKIDDVPFQRDVMNLWFKGRLGRTEEGFRDIRDRLGFDWLPTAKRGVKAYS